MGVLLRITSAPVEMKVPQPQLTPNRPVSALDSLLGCDSTDSDSETHGQDAHNQVITNEVLMYFHKSHVLVEAERGKVSNSCITSQIILVYSRHFDSLGASLLSSWEHHPRKESQPHSRAHRYDHVLLLQFKVFVNFP